MLRKYVKTLDGRIIERRYATTPADVLIIRKEESDTGKSLTNHSFGDLDTGEENNVSTEPNAIERDLGNA